ncbi:hypothetical protein Lupro_05905 [Lutibacter profundi]|uniref:Lysylphosphatidylglycerol synthetase n=1 Tax=Lutibacter profundi TaxID=1622118 RepID=A0A0X8G657_9FLAO|nr:lysylphosphatidylglycerol synthase domain-containing protein [Lutibacter profundi]AMC10802.1 hypothetical protein Lupro_05905 [Lutibacter profundi]
MYNISKKHKDYILLLVKLVIVFGSLYFIYHKLVNNKLLSFSELQQQITVLFSKNIWALLLILLFTDVNWLLETYKWKVIVSVEKKITFFEAFEQSFASLTASLITPNKIGEYGAKALFFKKKYRKKIVLLNFLGNMSQLAVTTFFGFIGITYFLLYFTINIPYFNSKKLVLIIAITIILFLIIKKIRFFKSVKIYVTKISIYLKQIPKVIYVKTIGFALLRYIVFTHQFYFLLKLFSVETNYITLINLLFCMYFIASIIPSLTIFDWAIKGSVAIWVFSFIELNELTIITVTLLMWLLNFAIPALLGSVFIFNFRFVEEK